MEECHAASNQAQRTSMELETELQKYVPQMVQNHAELVTQLDDHAHATRQWRSMQAKRDEKAEKQDQLENVKDFISLLKQAKTMVVSGAKDAFVAKVNEFLPEDKEFFVEFSDTQADYGLRHG